MGRRIGGLLCGALLLCVFAVSCDKADMSSREAKQNEPAAMKAQASRSDTSDISSGQQTVKKENNDANNNDNNIENKSVETIKESGAMDSKVDVKGDTISKNSLFVLELIEKSIDPLDLQKRMDTYPSGTVLNLTKIDKRNLDTLFYSENITDSVKERMKGKSYGENCDVPYSELRYIRVVYLGFDKKAHIGELVVNKAIAADTVDIFRQLYEAKYPIERMVLVDDYDADDNASMAADNTSSFNYRFVEGTKRISLHSYGLAIDINTLYNPYIREIDGKTLVSPASAASYVDRDKDNEHYIKAGDICYKIFTEHGFTWGGEWKNSKDYQHFEKALN